MGKPAKPGNDLPMSFGIVQLIGKHRPLGFRLLGQQGGKTRHRLVLHRQVLAMLENQIDKGPPNGRQLPVEIRRNPLGHESLGPTVAGKGLGCTTKDHPWQLIEQQHQGQPTFGALRPLGQSTGQCLLDLGTETLSRLDVLAVTLAEP